MITYAKRRRIRISSDNLSKSSNKLKNVAFLCGKHAYKEP